MRYLTHMGYDDRCFAAAVLSLAVKGGLRIEQVKKGLFGRKSEYTLHRTEPKAAEAFSQDEAELRRKLFAWESSVELDDKNHVVIGGAKSSHQSLLKREHTPSFFRINGGWHAAGIALSLLLGAGVVVLAATLGGFGPSWWFLTPAGWIAIGAALTALIANGAFGKPPKAPTVAGRAVMDHIARVQALPRRRRGRRSSNSSMPRRSRRSSTSAISPLRSRSRSSSAGPSASPASSRRRPRPTRLAGTAADGWNSSDVGRFTSGLGSSFSSAISSASTAPGSSSGSGGGGSSGGGGGGGGGGGW